MVALLLTVTQLSAGLMAETGERPTRALQLPAGASVRVTLLRAVATDTANVGDVLEFKVVRDIITDGLVVVARGARAWGRVKSVSRAGLVGKDGGLEIELTELEAITGKRLEARGSVLLKRRKQARVVGERVAHTAEAIGTGLRGDQGYVSVFVLPPALLGAALWSGERLSIREGERFEIPLGTLAGLDRSEVAASQPPPRKPTGKANLFIYRVLDGRRHLHPGLFCNQKDVGRLDEGYFVKLELTNGTYILQPEHGRSIEMTVSADREYFVRLDLFSDMTAPLSEVTAFRSQLGPADETEALDALIDLSDRGLELSCDPIGERK